MSIDHKTVVAYLNRVGVTEPTAGDAAGLRTLHRAHQRTVPFENLSIHLAEQISLDEPDLIDKIVREPLGGAHRNPRSMAIRLKAVLMNQLEELEAIPATDLLELRYKRLRSYGAYQE